MIALCTSKPIWRHGTQRERLGKNSHMKLTVLDHPLAGHLMSDLRDVSTPPERFRQICRALTTLLILEATKSLLTENSQVQTPLEVAPTRILGQGLAAVPVLRAGLGILILCGNDSVRFLPVGSRAPPVHGFCSKILRISACGHVGSTVKYCKLGIVSRGAGHYFEPTNSVFSSSISTIRRPP